jgi:hypothetical protein
MKHVMDHMIFTSDQDPRLQTVIQVVTMQYDHRFKYTCIHYFANKRYMTLKK